MKFLKTINKILAITIFCSVANQFTLPVKAATESSDKYYSVEDNKRYVTDNPVPDEYEDAEFIAALTIVAIGILVGTGRSIKYVENDRKLDKTKK